MIYFETVHIKYINTHVNLKYIVFYGRNKKIRIDFSEELDTASQVKILEKNMLIYFLQKQIDLYMAVERLSIASQTRAHEFGLVDLLWENTSQMHFLDNIIHMGDKKVKKMAHLCLIDLNCLKMTQGVATYIEESDRL